ncbi:hypothetical protein F0562_024595 [Nyssa sinensis]|uniref:Epidermal patterning factor-like protein n=1 Tax=Nyssa sinensis TaxID=561372 RepID=A0A5J5BD81_9ASTE|nr:hypothetical protein F0562_024595 [Nyssa sinensis]
MFCLEPVGLQLSRMSESSQRKMLLGSNPPDCVSKCMSCRPCMPTLVIPPPPRKVYRESSHAEDDTYYLLSWKCKCGDKLYQP